MNNNAITWTPSEGAEGYDGTPGRYRIFIFRDGGQRIKSCRVARGADGLGPQWMVKIGDVADVDEARALAERHIRKSMQ